MTGKKANILTKPLIAPTQDDGKFHLIKSEYPDNSLSEALKSGLITEDDKLLIEKHVAWLGRSNISPGRLNKITFHLVGSRRFLGSFCNNTIDDLIRGINRLKNDETQMRTSIQKKGTRTNRTRNGTISQSSRSSIFCLSRTTSHQFLRRILRRSKSPSDDTMTKTAAQMFDEEEILAMISACGSSMERVMIATLYEGALRIKELGTLTWERVSFNEQNVVINVNVKANKPRRIPLFIAIIAITSLIGYFGIIKKK